MAEILYLIFDYQQQLLDAIYSLKIVVGTIAFFGFFRVDFYLGCLGQVNLICTVIWKIDGSFIHKYALINLLTSSDQYSSIDLNLHAIYQTQACHSLVCVYSLCCMIIVFIFSIVCCVSVAAPFCSCFSNPPPPQSVS